MKIRDEIQSTKQFQNRISRSKRAKDAECLQAEGSTYKLVEAGVGGRLSRHNLQIIQVGPDTQTEFSTFQLAGKHQLQDLHSRLVLSHPRGVSRQLHKCIVTDSTGHAVFDGNVKVNRYEAQPNKHESPPSSWLLKEAHRSNPTVDILVGVTPLSGQSLVMAACWLR